MGHTAETRARAYEKMKQRRKEWFDKNGPCKHCGSWEALEVDHIDPKEKEHHNVWSWSEERRAAELEKCQPLCHTCHVKKTYQDFYQHLPKHGETGYHHGCRCDVCRRANTIARRKYRRNRGRLVITGARRVCTAQVGVQFPGIPPKVCSGTARNLESSQRLTR